MDSKTKIRVETIMEDLVEDGKMFTAYDLTKIIRAEVDQGVKIYHADVRALVNDIWFSDGQVFDDNNYTRSNIQIPGISMFAWIYHHSMTDPHIYDKDALPEDTDNADMGLVSGVKSSPDQTVFPSSIDSSDFSDDGNDNDNTLKPDARGRICVPKKALEAIGLEPGDEAYVVEEICSIKIWNCDMPNADIYLVDKSGNVRIQLNVMLLKYYVYVDKIVLG